MIRPDCLRKAIAEKVTTPGKYSISFLSPADVEGKPEIRDAWERVVQANWHLTHLYQSPIWWDHLRKSNGDAGMMLGVAKDVDSRLVGVAPLKMAYQHIKFSIGSRKLLNLPLMAVCVLGSRPVFPEDDRLFSDFLNSLWDILPDCQCIYFDSVLTDSYWGRFIRKSTEIREHSLVYIPEGVRPFHAIELPATAEEYFSRFTSKKRYNLKREVRMLRDHGDGRLELLRIADASDIGRFLDAAVEISRHSWQYRSLGPRISNEKKNQENLRDLADSKILRSYLLMCGKIPCAFVLGYQYDGVFHYVEIAYDKRFDEYSPGNVLRYMLIEDLFVWNLPRWLNFGIGDAFYKEQLANHHWSDSSVFLLRKTIPNRVRRDLHRAFDLLSRTAKSILRRDTS